MERRKIVDPGLRVLLIRKDFKLNNVDWKMVISLRVLLIRKDFKPTSRLLIR